MALEFCDSYMKANFIFLLNAKAILNSEYIEALRKGYKFFGKLIHLPSREGAGGGREIAQEYSPNH